MSKQNKIVLYCSYCKSPIWEGQELIKIGDNFYHSNKLNPLLNCYYPELEENEE